MPHILHRTWYINTGNMRRDRAQQHLQDWRDRIKKNDVLPHGVTAIDYFVPVLGNQPTKVDVLVIPTETWQATPVSYGVDSPLPHSPEPPAVMGVGAPPAYDTK